MKNNKELYQDMLDRQIEEQAKEQGLTVDDLLIMLDEQKAQEQAEKEMEENDEQMLQFYNL